MFEWFQWELSVIKTPRFHIIDGPSGAEFKEAVADSALPLPTSYREFVIKFGNAKLYRRARNNSYQIIVFAGPRQAILRDGTHIYHLGYHDGAIVYVKPSQFGYHDGASIYVEPSQQFAEPPIYEFDLNSEKRAAENFEEWLSKSCARARQEYGKRKWAKILRGPEPFTPEEVERLEARKRMHWRVLGVDESGDHIFEVVNTSIRTLPVLTIGVRSKDRHLNGAIILKIGQIGPGHTGILHANCYKGLKSPDEIEVYALPDPQPEDRDFFAEFRGIH